MPECRRTSSPDLFRRCVICLLQAAMLVLLAACGSTGVWQPYDPMKAAQVFAGNQIFGNQIDGNKPVGSKLDGDPPVGSNPDGDGKDGKGVRDLQAPPADELDALRVWGELPEGALDAYRAEYPDRTVVHDPRVFTTHWLDVLSAQRASGLDIGFAPDVFAYPAQSAGWAVGIDVFEDLTDYAYPLTALMTGMSPAEKAEGRTSDGYGRMALPVYTYPLMLAYRTDVFEAVGWPADPETVARRLADPAAWLDLARTMRQQGKTLMEWRDAPWGAGSRVWVPFRSDLSWRLNSETMRLAVATSAKIAAEALSADTDAGSVEGRRLLREGMLVTCLLSAADLDLLSEWVPEQAGLWRMTFLPMGMSSESGTIWLSMNDHCTRKREAWDFMATCFAQARIRQFALNESAAKFFGGQDLRYWVDEARTRMEPAFPTPMDSDVSEVFRNGLYSVYGGSTTAAAFLDRTEREIERTWRLEIAALRRTSERE